MAQKSWVWKYAERKHERAYCKICEEDNEGYTCPGVTTGSIGRHLKMIHKITQSADLSSSPASASASPKPTNSRKRPCNLQDKEKRPCSSEQREKINQALAKMVAINQLPLSFCVSDGFKKFMAVVEPNYKVCSVESLKARLSALRNAQEEIIKEKLKKSVGVACTSDLWSSRSQDCFITITAHVIGENWVPKSFTLSTHSLEERHSAQNIGFSMEKTFTIWDIQEKIVGIVTDNAANMVTAVNYLSKAPMFCENLTCAAHCIQLAVNKGLSCNNTIQALVQKASKLVAHFKHSNVAMHSLKEKQMQLGMTSQTLLQSCPTRWNSTYYMLERLVKNRIPVMNVLADRSISSSLIAQKHAINEEDWSTIESIIALLKPLEFITDVFCSDKASPISMVRPLLKQMIDNFFQMNEKDPELATMFKTTVANNLQKKFQIGDGYEPIDVLARQAASFLDPRYKDLLHESYTSRSKIVQFIKDKMQMCIQNVEEEEKEEKEEDGTGRESKLSFLYNLSFKKNDSETQLQNYLAEAQIRFDSNPFEWWKSHEKKYPTLSLLAKKILSIPATSTSSERCFSTAGNIVTTKRSCLLPDNVDMLVFLYQNRSEISELNN